VILPGLVAVSHDKKFLGSIAHDQMLKVWISLSLCLSLCKTCREFGKHNDRLTLHMVVCITCVGMKMTRKGVKFIGYCLIGNS
jgi:hypothetical protein